MPADIAPESSRPKLQRKKQSLRFQPRTLKQKTPEYHASELYKRAFFIGTEPEQYGEIYKHAWQFPTLVADLAHGARIEQSLREKKYVYVFGQTEPSVGQDLKIVTVPVLVALSSSAPLDLKIACTSVQATEVYQYELADFNCNLQNYEIAKVLLNEEKSGLRGNYPKESLNVQIVHNTRTRLLSKIVDQEEINKYTYSLLYLKTKSCLQTQLKSCHRASGADVVVELNGKSQNISIDLDDDFEYQAKFYILKYFTEGIDFNSINVDQAEVKPELVQQVAQKFKETKQKVVEEFKKKKAALEEELKQVEAQGIEIKVQKYYGKCEGLGYKDQKSAFVNRFVGKADLFE
ncbi:Conserved_hypothetical protein [Hexamita inflata]|uniref:Uncharacterized protein n=1 Tax=Hexamita inflata TaxID=28002 RepID=A0ABP1GXB1_9EUKA